MIGLPRRQQEFTDQRKAYIEGRLLAGATLADIGRELGISRERVSQIVGRVRHRPLPVGYITTGQAAKEFHLGSSTLLKWDKLGWITIRPNHTLNLEQLAHLVAQLKARPCWKCGAPVDDIMSTTVSCPEHRLSAKHKNFKPIRLWKKSSVAHHRELTNRWRAEHPEMTKIMVKRNRLVYKLVHKDGLDRNKAREIAAALFPYPPQ